MLAKPIVEALQSITRVTGTDVVSIRLHKRVLKFSGSRASQHMTVFVPFEDTGSWAVTVPKAALDSALKGRKNIEIAVVNNRLHLSDARFKAEYATEPYNDVPEKTSANALDIGEDAQIALQRALSTGSLAPIFEADTTFCAELSSEGCRFLCYDNLHFALVECGPVERNLSLVLPTRSFQTVVDTARGSAHSWSVTESAICAWNKHWEIVLPLIQGENLRTVADASAIVADFGEGTLRTGIRELYDAVVLAQSAVEAGGTLRLSARGRELRILGQSSNGKTSQVIECKLTGAWDDAWIDPKTLLSMLARAPGEVLDLGIHESKFLFIKAEDESSTATYASLLGNPPKGSKS